MAHQVLALGSGDLASTVAAIEANLPGYDAGLIPLTPHRLLMHRDTYDTLMQQYGSRGVRKILYEAGIVAAAAVKDRAAVALLQTREVGLLPPRPEVPIAPGELDWHLQAVRAPAAWGLLGGPDAIAWQDVRVGHIDTGYTPHPALGFDAMPWIDRAAARTFFAGNSLLDEAGSEPGVDPLNGAYPGHGTRTASTICGHAPDADGRPFYGIAPKVPVVPVRIANSVLIMHAQEELVKAVRYLVREAGVGVISLSMGICFARINGSVRRAINEAYESGVIFVCAAGNVVKKVVAPARFRRTLAIAGVTPMNPEQQLVPWGGSSHGQEVDLSGPACPIRRASWKPRGPRYGSGDGTSYATALVAGTAALWLARHAAVLAQKYPQPWQRVAAFKKVVCESAQVPFGWPRGEYGSGVLDAHAALTAPLPGAAGLQKEAKA